VPIITFAWTTPALVAGAKTTIRQPWSETIASRFHAGSEVAAYDRVGNSGGRQVACIRLTDAPVHQRFCDIPDEDYEREGWAWLHAHADLLPGYIKASDFSRESFEKWRSRPGGIWVVRYELVGLTPYGVALLAKLLRRAGAAGNDGAAGISATASPAESVDSVGAASAGGPGDEGGTPIQLPVAKALKPALEKIGA
jgi:hypothetical protein